MIQDVFFYAPRSVNIEQLSLGNIGLSTEQGRLLGLRNDQTVKGIVDSSGTNITLSTDHANLRMAISPSLTPGFSFLFKSSLTAQGVQLSVIRSALALAEDNSVEHKKVQQSPGKLAGFMNRINYLYNLNSPIAAIKVFANPELMQRIVSTLIDELPPSPEPDEILSKKESISANTLKTALIASGLFKGESKSSQKLTVKNILKMSRNNIESLKLSIKDLTLEDINDAIDYMDSSQLLGILRQEQQEPMYRFPILFQDAPAADICIYRDAKDEQKRHQESFWKVDIELPLNEKHALSISAQLKDASVLDLYIWTSDRTLLTLLESSISVLRNNLSMWDIALNTCQILFGERPPGTASEKPHYYRAGTSLDCLT